MVATPAPRTAEQRKADALALLQTQTTAWLATNGRRGPHLVPLVFHYHGGLLTFATFTDTPTVRNLAADNRARPAIGHPYDVVMIDGAISIVDPPDIATEVGDAHAALLDGGPDPRRTPGLSYLQLAPRRIQSWRTFAELADRTIMRSGQWLA